MFCIIGRVEAIIGRVEAKIMSKLLSFLIIGILVLGGLGAVAENKVNKVISESETINFSTPVIREKDSCISIDLPEKTINSWEKDKPTLPVVTKVYTFPFGTQIENVKVTFSKDIKQTISKPIESPPELQIKYVTHVANNIKNSKTLKTYSDIDIYPEHRYGYRTGAGLLNEQHVIYLTVDIYPVEYHPKENAIYYSTSVDIDISYVLPEKPVSFPDEYDLLIIVPDEFKSAFQRLADHKNNLDPPVKTKLVTLNEIPSVGVDKQESIKYYIKDAVENWGVTYVLLVGAGVEGEEIFPVRQAWIGSGTYENYFPCDLYYADIYNGTGGFSNWDFDGDGKYAEYPTDFPNVDVYPDVYLGKLPCNNVDEANTIVDKIIFYKEHNKMVKKILQMGGDSVTGDPEDIYEDEYAEEKVLEKLPGYSATQLWASNGKLTKKNIAEGFKDGVDFVEFSGHGSWASWATHPFNDEETWIPPKTLISPYTGFLYIDYDIYMVNNAKKLPVIVFTACSNHKYTESPNCIGWRGLSKKNGGGIASFAEAGIGTGPGGTQCVDRYINWMEVKVFEELYNTKILGQVWSNCVADYYNNFELDLNKDDYKTILEFSMFGDPTLAIEDGDDPINIPVNKPLFHGVLQRHMGFFHS